jgi:hypothetical protein
MTSLEEAREQLRELRARPSWQYAFGHLAPKDHPAIREIRDEDARLIAIIEEHGP